MSKINGFTIESNITKWCQTNTDEKQIMTETHGMKHQSNRVIVEMNG